jgi:hypothetical protein
MNYAFYSEPLERAIVTEITQWSADALEKPSPFFNGLPPCPYARQAWMDSRVAYSLQVRKELSGSLLLHFSVRRQL